MNVSSPQAKDLKHCSHRDGRSSRHVARLCVLVLAFGALGTAVTPQWADAETVALEATNSPTPPGAGDPTTASQDATGTGSESPSVSPDGTATGSESTTASPEPTGTASESNSPSPDPSSAPTASSAPTTTSAPEPTAPALQQPMGRVANAVAPSIMAAAAVPGSDGFATGGSGNFKQQIQWMVWNPTVDPTYKTILGSGQVKNDEFGKTVTNGPNLNISTATTTMTRTYGDAELQTTCNLSNPTANVNTSGRASASSLLKAYTPGGWAGDGLDNLYNVGGPGYWTTNAPTATVFPRDYRNPNTFRIGLRNDADHANISFDYSCSAVLVRGGASTPVTLQGLVFADAEASSDKSGTSEATQGEWIKAQPLSTVTDPTWYLLDHYRNGCTTDVNVAMTGTTMTMGPNGQECAYASGGTYGSPLRNGDGPMANMFLKGATSARVTLQGRGYSAVALGVVVQADLGDAPESYGTSGSLFQPNWNNPVPANGGGVYGMTQAKLQATNSTGPTLGTTIDPDGLQPFTADALGDDNDTSDDEDALAAAPSIPLDVLNGTTTTFTVANVTCTPASGSTTGRVRGWIDWDGNGVFDTNEASAPAPCTGTTSLTFQVPVVPADTNLVNKAATFLRLRAYNEGDTYGSNPKGMTLSGEVEDYRVPLPSVLKLVKSVTNTYGGTSVATDWKLTANTVEYPQDKYRFVNNNATYTLAESANTVDATQGYTWESLTCQRGTIGTTPATDTGTSKASPSVSITSGTATLCTFVNKDKPGSLTWNKVDANGAKLAGSEWTLTGPGVPAGTTVTDCTASPCTAGAYKDQDPAAGQFKLTGLPRGNYSVTESKAPTGYLVTTGTFSFQTLPIPTSTPWVWDSTLKPVTGVVNNGIVNKKPPLPIYLQKQGLNCDVGQPTCALEGAEFAIYATDPMATGATPITNGITANSADLSKFTSIALEVDKDYWIVETKAPAGFVLLATPIKFKLSSTGITLADTSSSIVQLAPAASGANAAFTIVVSDTTAAPLPQAGSSGHWPFVWSGMALFLVAGLYLTQTSGLRLTPRRVDA